jgi:hypothetical protein
MAAVNPKPEPEYNAAHVPMSEEFDDAKHSLPPIAPVVIAMVVVAIVVIGAALLLKQPPASGGSIGDVYAVEVPNQNLVLCTVQLTVENHTKKPLVIRGVSATVHTSDQGDLSDTAAPAGDFERYLDSFPDMKSHATTPLRGETKIPVGGNVSGSIIVAFPLTLEKFNQRKGIEATVELYDYTDLRLKK